MVLVLLVVVVVVVRVVLVELLVRARVKRGGVTGVRRCWRGWAGDPNSVHAAGYKKKATAALLASFSMRIVFDAGVIFFSLP